MLAAYFSLRMGGREGLAEAARWTPNDASIPLENARVSLRAGDFSTARREFESAVRLADSDFRTRIEYASFLEAAGDAHGAESELQKASGLSKTFAPRWALANFYFRQGRTREASESIRSAQLTSGAPLAATFRLCEANAANLEVAIRQCISPLEIAFAEYLLDRGRVLDALRVHRHCPVVPRKLAQRLVEGAIRAGVYDEALPLWQRLADTDSALSKPLPWSIVNGALTRTPTSVGFDWHTGSEPWMLVTFRHPGVSIEVSGAQPEVADAMWQFAYFSPSKRYELQVQYRTDVLSGGAPTVTVTGDHERRESEPLVPSEWRESILRFAGTGWSRVALAVHRRTGYSRFEGTITLRSIRVRELP